MKTDAVRFRQSDEFIFRRIADEVILVPIRQRVGDLQSIYTLTPVAARIWESLDGATSAGAIARQLVEEYEVTVEQAGADLNEFLQSLREIGAIRQVAGERA